MHKRQVKQLYDDNFVRVIPGYEPTSDMSNIQVVPNPYIVDSEFEEFIYKNVVRFEAIPGNCILKIFTITGEMVNEKHHLSLTDGNIEWDLRNQNNQLVAPGIYIYTVEDLTINETFIGKMGIFETFIRFKYMI